MMGVLDLSWSSKNPTRVLLLDHFCKRKFTLKINHSQLVVRQVTAKLSVAANVLY